MTARKLTYEDAIDIWVRFWIGDERHKIVRDYDQNPMRVYEIWWEEKFRGSRQDAEMTFRTRYPERADRMDFSPLKKTRRFVRRGPTHETDSDQGWLF
ncbi:MAG TPA: hypothetical protein VFF87_00125 [Hyphomicrobium sp.]|nr:hypothetical protein [Hyphomicrobium sp.]